MAYTFLIRFLSFFYLVALVGLGFLFFLYFSQNYRELSRLQEREAALQRTIEAREAELIRKETYARKLAEDPEFLERIIREQLGFIRPGEFLFRFDEDITLVP